MVEAEAPLNSWIYSDLYAQLHAQLSDSYKDQ